MLTAGAAKLDITPHLGASLAGGMTARPAVDVHDPLHVRCVVLGDGETDLALVCCDLIVLSASDVACVKRDVRTRTGISPERVLICATHTHTGPSTDGLLGVDREEDYMAWAVRRMADVVVMAQQRLRPASAGWGSASLPGQVFNRRYRMSDGTVRTNPGVENPDVVEPAGPTDPEIGLLVMRDGSDGTPIAAVGNYALHYVGGGDGRSVSADYFAVVEQALNREKGHAFPVLWTNGCSGDINNVDVRTLRSDRSPYGQMVRVAEDVAREALGIWSGLSFEDSLPLGSALEDVQVARRAISDFEVEEAKPLVPGAGEEWTSEGVFAREVVLLSRWHAWEAAPVQAMRIGDLGIAALPGEIFVEFGLEVKAASTFKQTMVVELANGYVGYVPTVVAFEEGGYETRTARSSRLAPEAGPEMTRTAVRLLGEVRDGSAGMKGRSTS